MSSSNAAAADAQARAGDDPSVVVRRSQSDFRLLQTGEFSDFTIVCGNREWKVHKAILSKVPYFNATVGGGFKEAIQEKITIEELFEPFDIQWLLEYIYFPHFDPETARLVLPSKSYLEACVRLWHLGDYFQVKTMSTLAKDRLDAGCERWRRHSSQVDTFKQGTTSATFILDLESAIRQAWREDLAPGPLQAILITLCIEFAPYIRRHQSFLTLLQEVPQFAVTFSQRALSCIPSAMRLPKPDYTMEQGPSLIYSRAAPDLMSPPDFLRRIGLDRESSTRTTPAERATMSPGIRPPAQLLTSRTSNSNRCRLRDDEPSDQGTMN